MRNCLISLLIACSVMTGCTQPIDHQGGEKKKKPDPAVKETRLEQLAFESFQKRDALRAANLRTMKGVKYDAKRMSAIAEAGSRAATESWKPVAEELSKRLDDVPQEDQKSFDAVLEELARAAEKAAK